MISPAPTKGTKMKKKKVVRRAWSKEDIRTLKTMAQDKRGVKKIAKALKRSPGGCKARDILEHARIDRKGCWNAFGSRFAAKSVG
jgi:hypothetical protein